MTRTIRLSPPLWPVARRHFCRLRPLAAATTLLVTLLAARMPARAHDVWLEPETFFAVPGQEIGVPLRMGERLRVEDQKPFHRDAVTRFQLVFSSPRKRPLDLLTLTQEGQQPFGRIRLDGGNALLVLDRSQRRLTLDAEKFNRYLADENQTAALTQRAQLGQSTQLGKERYIRYLKALVQDREPSAAPAVLYRRRIGQRLEILLENDPAKVRVGQRLSVKVIFDGRPLPGMKVSALHRDRDGTDARILSGTTDARGRTSFAIDAPGFWLVRLVYLRPIAPADRKDGDDSQWESFWSSYSFAVRLLPAVSATTMPGSSSPTAVRP
ncbi:MAG: DUF4198 domain-containing protein [Verrucomicrobia bacterium]|nr:DUF4198 domain-containing protein [Verrucomicrobiota bacterium]